MPGLPSTKLTLKVARNFVPFLQMFQPDVRVHFSIRWLRQTLQEFHQRGDIPRTYLVNIYREVIHSLEADLTAGRKVSIDETINMAIHVMEVPTWSIG